jgi:hypothetical protein
MGQTTATLTPATASGTVDRYVAVWNEPDPAARRSAIAGLWAPDGAEFVHEKQFRGHEELAARVTGAYEAFVASGKYAVTSAGDVTCHDDIVIFTAQLRTPDGAADWEARVFLVLGPGNLIREDYQLTVKPLPA